MPAATAAPPAPTPEQVGAHMFAADRASQGLGMRIVAIGAGSARLEMPIRDDMLNGHEICHGGFITTLADSAFAFACNTYDRRTVAQHCAVTFIAPSRLGEVLSAHALEVSRAGRSGIYDVTVTGDGGAVVAEFRGHSRTIKGSLLGGEGKP